MSGRHNTGAAEFAAPEALMADWAAQRASIVRRQVAEILDIFDQRIERRLQRANLVHATPFHDGSGYIARALRSAGLYLIRVSQKRHQHAPEGVDPDLEKIEAVLNLRKTIGIRGHESAPADDGMEPSEADAGTHRLSGAAK